MEERLQESEERLQQFDPFQPQVSGVYPYLNNLGTYTPGIDYDMAALTAMRVSTYFTCLLVRAESLSTLPCGVFQSSSKGAVPLYNDPAYVLVHNKPNPFQTAADFWKTVSAHIDNNGNCYAFITYSGRFQPIRLDIYDDPDSVTISRTESGNKVFTIDGKIYRDWEILHFKDLSLDGVYGCSKIRYNASTLGYSASLRKYGNNAILSQPPGFFTTDQGYNVLKSQEENLSKGWRENTANGKMPVLAHGLTFNPMMINPNDAQYLDAIGATKEDIYGFMRVPPTLAQNYERATFSNAEQQDLVFVKYTMLPLITNIEQECNAKLFAEGNAESATPKYVKFNVSAFMRGDFRTRTDGYRTLIQTGAMTINQVAELEDWPKVEGEGGDERFIPMNLITLNQQKAFIESLTKPIDTNAGNEGGTNDSAKAGRSEGLTLEQLLKMRSDDVRPPITENGIVYKPKNGHVNGH